jgi:hypothetical protein
MNVDIPRIDPYGEPAQGLARYVEAIAAARGGWSGSMNNS